MQIMIEQLQILNWCQFVDTIREMSPYGII